MADAERLVRVGMPVQQANELAAQIDEGGGGGDGQAIIIAERAERVAYEAKEEARTFESLDAARAAYISSEINFLEVVGQRFQRDPQGDLQTSDGQRWGAIAGARPNSLVVRVPSHYPTVQAALDATYGLKLGPSASTTILIEAGHQLTHGWRCVGGSWSHYRIASEDAVVRTVETGFVPVTIVGHPEGPRAVAYYENCSAPRWSFLLRGWGDSQYNGIQTLFGTELHVDAGCGVQNMRRNLAMRQGGIISANDAIVDGALLNCAMFTNGVTGSISGLSANDGWTAWATDGASFADASIHISRACVIQAQGVKTDRCGAAAVTVRRSFASLLSAVFGSVGLVSGNTTVPLRYQDGSHVNARFSTFNGAPLTESNISGQAFNAPSIEGICYYEAGPTAGYNAPGSELSEVSADGQVVRAGFYRWGGGGWGPDTGVAGGGAVRLDRGTDRGTWIAASASRSSKEPRVFAKTTGSETGVYGPWRELFHQGNFLGPVSVDGNGMPSGAALESAGSFSGGYYLRFLDGTMICYRAFNTPATATFDETVSFPSPFLAGETIYGGHIGGNTVLSGAGFPDRAKRFHCLAVTASTSGWRVFLGSDISGMHTNYPATTEPLAIRLFAIGRWR